MSIETERRALRSGTLSGSSRRGLLPSRRVATIGAAGGVMSGLLGVGGGTVMVPLLVLWGSVTQRDAHALSLGAIVPISIVGVVTYGAAGEIEPAYAAALAVGSIAGARIGAGWLARASEHALKLMFGVFLVGVAVAMVVTR